MKRKNGTNLQNLGNTARMSRSNMVACLSIRHPLKQLLLLLTICLFLSKNLQIKIICVSELRLCQIPPVSTPFFVLLIHPFNTFNGLQPNIPSSNIQHIHHHFVSFLYYCLYRCYTPFNLLSFEFRDERHGVQEKLMPTKYLNDLSSFLDDLDDRMSSTPFMALVCISQ